MTPGTFVDHILPLGDKSNDFETISAQFSKYFETKLYVKLRFSSRDAAEQHRPSQNASSRNWRELRPCQHVFVFYRCTGRTVPAKLFHKVDEGFVLADDCLFIVHRPCRTQRSEEPLAMRLSRISLLFPSFRQYVLRSYLSVPVAQQSSRPGGMRVAVK